MFRYGPLNFTKQSHFEILRLVLGSKATRMFYYCFNEALVGSLDPRKLNYNYYPLC